MAEGGFLERFLGGGEGEETESEVSAPSSDPIAATVAVDAARFDPDLSRKAGEYLDEQRRLVKIQTEHLHEQRAVQLSHLKLRRFTDRLKAGTQLFIIMVATVIGLGVLVMLYDAFNSKAVIVEPFDAPPALAARGLTGKVVAGTVLDALTRLQASTRSSSAKRNLSNAWTGDIKVEVPETGVSIGDIDRMLKARFGRDIHIDGDLVETDAGGLALTIRGYGVLPKTFEGGPTDLGKLTTQAAEYVYGQSEPALYAGYLMNAGRNVEDVAFIKAAYATATPADRPYLLNVWADALENSGAPVWEAVPLYRAALKLKPDYWTAYNNLMNVDLINGDEEGAWREAEAMRRAAGGRPGRADEKFYQNVDQITWNLAAWRAAAVADAAAVGGVGANISAEAPIIAVIDVDLHDDDDAELQLQTAQGDATDASIGAITHFVHGRLATESGDAERAVAEMEAFGSAYGNPIVASNYAGYNCWIAPAEEAAGHPDRADAALKAGGHYVDCYRFRGDILDHRGDWADAQKAYAAAVAIAPDLPAGYYSWGVALARHGDLADAVKRLEAANQRGPNWADPLKAWGDVLAREGRWKDALTKYGEALKRAPAWIELRQRRDTVARKA